MRPIKHVYTVGKNMNTVDICMKDMHVIDNVTNKYLPNSNGKVSKGMFCKIWLIFKKKSTINTRPDLF